MQNVLLKIAPEARPQPSQGTGKAKRASNAAPSEAFYSTFFVFKRLPFSSFFVEQTSPDTLRLSALTSASIRALLFFLLSASAHTVRASCTCAPAEHKTHSQDSFTGAPVPPLSQRGGWSCARCHNKLVAGGSESTQRPPALRSPGHCRPALGARS